MAWLLIHFLTIILVDNPCIYIYIHYMHNMLNVINHSKPSPVLRLWDAFTIPLLFARYAQSLTLTWIKPHSHIVSLKTEKSEFVQIPWVIIFCPFFSATFGAKKSPFFRAEVAWLDPEFSPQTPSHFGSPPNVVQAARHPEAEKLNLPAPVGHDYWI